MDCVDKKDGKVQSVENFLQEYNKFIKYGLTKNEMFFFRGHSSSTYKLLPSIYRETNGDKKNSLVLQESKMIDEAIRLFPDEFDNSMSTIEQLVKMQHYGLPTRLLDVTSNPLVALYFACEEEEKLKEDGIVYLFRVSESDVFGVESDSVSVLANVAKQHSDFKYDAYQIDDCGYLCNIGCVSQLLHSIQREKPYFKPYISPGLLNSVILVQTKMNNPRIIRQFGAFFLFGIKGEKNCPSDFEYPCEEIIVDANSKEKILEELEAIGISKATLFPEMDNVLKCIKKKYDK